MGCLEGEDAGHSAGKELRKRIERSREAFGMILPIQKGLYGRLTWLLFWKRIELRFLKLAFPKAGVSTTEKIIKNYWLKEQAVVY